MRHPRERLKDWFVFPLGSGNAEVAREPTCVISDGKGGAFSFYRVHPPQPQCLVAKSGAEAV